MQCMPAYYLIIHNSQVGHSLMFSLHSRFQDLTSLKTIDLRRDSSVWLVLSFNKNWLTHLLRRNSAPFHYLPSSHHQYYYSIYQEFNRWLRQIVKQCSQIRSRVETEFLTPFIDYQNCISEQLISTKWYQYQVTKKYKSPLQKLKEHDVKQLSEQYRNPTIHQIKYSPCCVIQATTFLFDSVWGRIKSDNSH